MDAAAILITTPTRTWTERIGEAGQLTVGGDGADVRLSEPSVFPIHVTVFADGNVDATGPALLNGVQLSGRAVLRPGDEVQIGEAVLVFQRSRAIAAEPQRRWPWEAFTWLVAEELERGVDGALRLSRAPFEAPGARLGALGDKLYGAFGPGVEDGVRSADPFELFERAMSKLLGLPAQLDDDEQLVQDAVMLRLLSLAERFSDERASVLIIGEPGVGKWSFARRIAPEGKQWRGESVAPSGPLLVRGVELLDDAAKEQVCAALRGGRQVVATASAETTPVVPFNHVVRLPPVRDRPSEIEPLADVFLTRARRALGLRRVSLSAPVKAALLRASYPRNVSELNFVMEVAAIVSGSEEVSLDALPSSFRTGVESTNLRATMKTAEKEALLHALGRTRWNVSAAARLLGLPRRTVVYRMSRLGLRRPARG